MPLVTVKVKLQRFLFAIKQSAKRQVTVIRLYDVYKTAEIVLIVVSIAVMVGLIDYSTENDAVRMFIIIQVIQRERVASVEQTQFSYCS